MGNAIRNCGSKELSGAAARTGILIKKARTIYKRKDALMFIENVEGKDYTVEDGDVMHFRFNV